MWKWVLLGVVAFLAWRWYKAGFVEVSEDKSTYNVKVRKLTGLLEVLDPNSKKDNINFGTVEAPAPNIDPNNGYWRTLNGNVLSVIKGGFATGKN